MPLVVAVCGNGTQGDHGWIESHPNEAESEGWHIRPWREDFDQIPVLLHGERWVLLTEDGEYVSFPEP